MTKIVTRHIVEAFDAREASDVQATRRPILSRHGYIVTAGHLAEGADRSDAAVARVERRGGPQSGRDRGSAVRRRGVGPRAPPRGEAHVRERRARASRRPKSHGDVRAPRQRFLRGERSRLHERHQDRLYLADRGELRRFEAARAAAVARSTTRLDAAPRVRGLQRHARDRSGHVHPGGQAAEGARPARSAIRRRARGQRDLQRSRRALDALDNARARSGGPVDPRGADSGLRA